MEPAMRYLRTLDSPLEVVLQLVLCDLPPIPREGIPFHAYYPAAGAGVS